MNLKEEKLKEIRRNEQENVLKDLKNRFFNLFKKNDFNMQVTITLENYLPEYHLKYDRNDLFKFLEDCISLFKINVNSYLCLLFKEIEPNSDGWFFYCDDYYGGSILINEDGIVLYNWHYNFNRDDKECDFQSVLISAYFSMLSCFLPRYYEKIDYNNRINLELNFEGIEKCVFYPPKSEYGFKNYNNNCKIPIKRIFDLKILTQKNKIVNTVSEIFLRILSSCFDHNQFVLHNSIKIFIDRFYSNTNLI